MIKDKIDIIRELSVRTEMIAQLAEEANELAIATMEIKDNIIYKNNDEFIEKRNNFLEEVADVKVTIDIIGDYNEKINPSFVELRHKDACDMLAKSCCELAKACIKYRRTLVPNASPTPVTETEAEYRLIEAITKVRLYINSLGNYWDYEKVNKIYKEKVDRCIDRMSKTK